MGIMIRHKGTFFLGIFIFLIPFLGLPSFWKTIMVIVSGLVLITLSISVIVPDIHDFVPKKHIVPEISKAPEIQAVPEAIVTPIPKKPRAPRTTVRRKKKVETVIVPEEPTNSAEPKLQEIE